MSTYAIAVAISLIGAALHWVKRYGRGQTESSLKEYLLAFKEHTFASLGAILASVGAVLSSGQLDVSDPFSISTLILGGYALDSSINKDTADYDAKSEELDTDKVIREEIQTIDPSNPYAPVEKIDNSEAVEKTENTIENKT